MSNRIKEAFEDIHAESGLKASTMAYIMAQEKKAPVHYPRRPLAAAFACLALIVLGIAGRQVYMKPVSAISVDVNPSIELGVNRFDRIVSVEGYNEDGERLAAEVDIRRMNYSDGLDALLDSEAMRPYIENDGLVSITVIGPTEEKSAEMLELISGAAYAAKPNVECQCGNREEVVAAHLAGLSFGKYQAFLELKALDPGVTEEDVSGMTMRQIKERIAELSGVPWGGGSHKNGNRHNS